MNYLRVTDDTDRAGLEEAITHLRAKQLVAGTEQVRGEIADDIDELLDMLADAPR